MHKHCSLAFPRGKFGTVFNFAHFALKPLDRVATGVVDSMDGVNEFADQKIGNVFWVFHVFAVRATAPLTRVQ